MTLNCGHLLEKICYEPSFCNKKCNQPNLNCLFKHLCQKPCGVACGPCMMPIQSILPCNHISEILCYESPDSVECTARVNRTLSCGHQVDVLCGSDEQVSEHTQTVNFLIIFYWLKYTRILINCVDV